MRERDAVDQEEREPIRVGDRVTFWDPSRQTRRTQLVLCRFSDSRKSNTWILRSEDGKRGFRVNEEKWCVVGCGPILHVDSGESTQSNYAMSLKTRKNLESKVTTTIERLLRDLEIAKKAVTEESSVNLVRWDRILKTARQVLEPK